VEPIFGRIALEQGYLTPEQHEDLLSAYGRREGGTPMGHIALKKGYLTSRQVETVLALQIQEHRRLRESTWHPVTSGGETTGVDASVDLLPLVRSAALAGASDLHLHADAVPRVRVGGALAALPGAEPLPREEVEALIRSLLDGAQRRRWQEEWEIDLACDLEPGLRVRANAYWERKGPAVCLRLASAEAPSQVALGLPTDLARLTTLHNGPVLLAGPSRSGKTTTLAALVRLVNEERKHNIILVEDPIEIVHPSRQSTILQREVGPDTRSFAAALKAALREDPDVIVVGELRDPETIGLAITAAETGHLVLGTMSTRTAVETVSRIVDAFPAEQREHVRGLVADSLRGVVAQTLYPLGGGRLVPVIEVLTRHPGVSTCIRDDKLHQIPSIMQTARKQGMRLFTDSIDELFRAGTLTPAQRDDLRARLVEG